MTPAPERECFLSCDWGTSSFRLKLVDTTSLNAVARVSNDRGIRPVHRSLSAAADGDERRREYLAVIREAIDRLEDQTGQSLRGLPVIISGMASASMGMIELPYKDVPFAIDGSDLVTNSFAPDSDLDHPILIISGACTDCDVLRGEETLLVGVMAPGGTETNDTIAIFPGTHSKHVVVSGGMAVDFRTFMTGEVFELLSRHSVLAETVEPEESLAEPGQRDAFLAGVEAGASGNLLNACFQARARHLLGKADKRANFLHLSGVLIGAELGDMALQNTRSVTLVAGERLRPFYEAAFTRLGLSSILSIVHADEALVTGQLSLARSSGLIASGRT